MDDAVPEVDGDAGDAAAGVIAQADEIGPVQRGLDARHGGRRRVGEDEGHLVRGVGYIGEQRLASGARPEDHDAAAGPRQSQRASPSRLSG
ncbi:MAG: hypothetical protein ACRDRQ_24370 [Pseudonocardiaceae bacterium]